jgi:hypothetical protein
MKASIAGHHVSTAVASVQLVDVALIGKGGRLGWLGRSVEAIEVFDRVIEGYRDDPARRCCVDDRCARRPGLGGIVP